MKPLLLIIILVTMVLNNCKKHEPNPCQGLTLPGAYFGFKETLRDTAFFTDTAYWDNAVNFTALSTYSNVSWKIGTDPRDFNSPNFSLPFYLFTGTIDVRFTGRNTPNTQCFAADSGVYHGTKKLTLVEQFDRSTLTLSPLLGRYRGAFTNTPADTFTVRIEYFDSAKYDASVTGNQNFYWVSNMPRGFRNLTNAAAFYPELRNGLPIEMGYKCAQFGSSAIDEGLSFTELKSDTLKIYYNNPATGRKIWVGKRI